jgi:hypothetical protein
MTGIAEYCVRRCIKGRKLRRFCPVVVALGCLEIPYGTLLGFLTFVVVEPESMRK